MLREAAKATGVDPMSRNPSDMERLIEQLQKQNPTDVLPEIDITERMKELRGAFNEKTKSYQVEPTEAQTKAMQEARAREAENARIKARRREATKAQEVLQERIRRLNWQQERGQQGLDTQGLQQALQQGMGGQGMGAQGGMGMAQPMQQQMPISPLLDPQQAMRFPQGDTATADDAMQLGALVKHFSTIMGLSPGGATMTDIAQAYQWFAQNSKVAQLPLDIEMYAQGVPGGMMA